jgi:alpha-beta hydrolase superfamily lysophospholipase
VDCFDKLVNDNEKDTEFIIISHSIGSYISMELLRQRPNHGIKRVIALFPTIREIAATPNGIQISVSNE